jgi:isoleucyl-tRNA synthetase
VAAYDEFAFHHVVQGLVNFCAVDLSALYLDVVKDRLYTAAATGPARRAAQTALWRMLDTMVRLMAPIVSYTADEIWGYVPGRAAVSVFEAGLPTVDAALVDEALAARWEQLLAARAVVTKALEEARQAGIIGHSLDARVRLVASAGLRPLLDAQAAALPALFIVSQVELADALGDTTATASSDELAVVVERARGDKCGRCWNYSEAVGSDVHHPALCERCLPVVQALPVAIQESA